MSTSTENTRVYQNAASTASYATGLKILYFAVIVLFAICVFIVSIWFIIPLFGWIGGSSRFLSKNFTEHALKKMGKAVDSDIKVNLKNQYENTSLYKQKKDSFFYIDTELISGKDYKTTISVTNSNLPKTPYEQFIKLKVHMTNEGIKMERLDNNTIELSDTIKDKITTACNIIWEKAPIYVFDVEVREKTIKLTTKNIGLPFVKIWIGSSIKENWLGNAGVELGYLIKAGNAISD